jgi:glycosyltransferase involved in cell wall biosynthesis
MRVALVHDWLTGMRGGENVLHELASMYPDADLYTLIHVPGSTSELIEARTITASPLSRLPGAAQHYRVLLPLFPWAIERFRLTGYDIVISTSHAVAKGVRCDGPHLCYCFTPMRYIWDQIDAYLGNGAVRLLASPLVSYLRRWDRRTSTPARVTRFVGISEEVVQRIRRHYDRDADLIHPPVDTHRITPSGRPHRGYYLMVGGFVPYKREEIAIDAFAGLDRTLIVAGDGPTRAAMQARAPSNVHFRGRVSDSELVALYQDCRALVYPQHEDFGIIAVEAQAAGRPVIAFGQGGARDTVVPLAGEALTSSDATGIWFDEQSPEALTSAVREFERREHEFDSKQIRLHAERFSAGRFRSEIAAAVERTHANSAASSSS